MSPNSSGPNDSPTQSPEERRETVKSLMEGDEIIVNGRQRSLTVCEITCNETENWTRSILAGNGTTYALTVVHESHHIPVISWPSADHPRPVRHIKPAGATILSTICASDVFLDIAEENNANTHSKQRESAFPDVEGDTLVIGSCPACDSIVIVDGERAVCSACYRWCWLTRWTGHYERETIPEGDEMDSSPKTIQKTLHLDYDS